MLSHESHNRLRYSGLDESAQIIGCLYSLGAFSIIMGSYIPGALYRMGAYIRKVLVRTEMGAYIHGCLYSRGAYYHSTVFPQALPS